MITLTNKISRCCGIQMRNGRRINYGFVLKAVSKMNIRWRMSNAAQSCWQSIVCWQFPGDLVWYFGHHEEYTQLWNFTVIGYTNKDKCKSAYIATDCGWTKLTVVKPDRDVNGQWLQGRSNGGLRSRLCIHAWMWQVCWDDLEGMVMWFSKHA